MFPYKLSNIHIVIPIFISVQLATTTVQIVVCQIKLINNVSLHPTQMHYAKNITPLIYHP